VTASIAGSIGAARRSTAISTVAGERSIGAWTAAALAAFDRFA